MAPANRPAGGRQRSENNGPQLSQKDLSSCLKKLQRLLAVGDFMNNTVFLKDLEDLEGVFGDEIKKDEEIKMLRQRVSSVFEAKEEESERIKEENKELKTRDKALQEERERFDRHTKEEEKKLSKTKKELEQGRNALKEELQKKRNELERESKKEIKQAKENALAEVQATVDGLNEENKQLRTKVDEQKDEYSSEVKRYKALEKDQEQKIQLLKKNLEAVDPDSTSTKASMDEYRKIPGEIAGAIARLADAYFENIPKDADDMPVDINPFRYLGCQNNLAAASRIFGYTPGSDVPAAQLLRKCAVRHFVASEISTILENKVFEAHTSTGREKSSNGDEEVLQRIYDSPGLGSHEKKVWKNITLKAMGGRAGFAEVAEEMSGRIVERLAPLIEVDKRGRIQGEFRDILMTVLDFWGKIRRENCKLTVVREPGATKDGTWEEIEDLPADENPAVSPSQASLSTKPGSFAIFPRMTVKFEDAVDGEDGGAVSTLHPGIGLFSNSPLFSRAEVEFRLLKGDIASTHKRRVTLSSPTKNAPPMWSASPTGSKSNGHI